MIKINKIQKINNIQKSNKLYIINLYIINLYIINVIKINKKNTYTNCNDMYSLFIFRRDLRLIDNTGLLYALKNYKNVIPIFIYTPEQIGDKNKYRSENAIIFMNECLEELLQDCKKYNSYLYRFYGTNIDVLKKIIKNIEIENIITNMDYTPYAIKRDKEISKLCKDNNINFHHIEDYLLAPIGTFCKANTGDVKEPYRVFTPFKNYLYSNDKYINEPNKKKSLFKNLVESKGKYHKILMDMVIKKVLEII